MSVKRLQQLFSEKNQQVLNVYCTAGYPQLTDTLPVMRALQAHGADMIELGMPYSDPIADGPVIQQSNMTALENGMTIATLFAQLKNFRTADAAGTPPISVPVILMGYMNPVLQYGFEKFCAQAAEVGIDGLILPDLPEHEFETMYGAIVKQYGLDFIFLVTPETAGERIKKLDELSTGFLYAVSSSSTTGGISNADHVLAYAKKLQLLQLKNPILVGFGVKDHASFTTACTHSNGAIIGSAYIKALENTSDLDQATEAFLGGILG
jgi:tryptophan synthase alpha chain